jgi:hypothetical protein
MQNNSHNLYWISQFPMTLCCVDQCISAEIPDPRLDPELHALVMTHMVHGRCGIHNPNAPCMKDGVCFKKYPFALQPTTTLTEGSFASHHNKKD